MGNQPATQDSREPRLISESLAVNKLIINSLSALLGVWRSTFSSLALKSGVIVVNLCPYLPVGFHDLSTNGNFAETSHKLRIFSCLDLIEPVVPIGEGFEDWKGDFAARKAQGGKNLLIREVWPGKERRIEV